MGTAPFDYSQYFQQQPWNPGTTMGSSAYSYAPNYDTYDPSAAMRGNRNSAMAWGQNMDSNLAQQQQYASGLESYYRQPMDAAGGQLAGTPGFTPDELANITRGGQYQAGVTTSDQYSAMGPSAAEYTGMGGDPNSLYGWFDPKYQEDINRSSADQQRGQFGSAQGRLDQALGQQSKGYSDALGAQGTQLDQSYLPGIQSAYAGHAGAIDAATNSQNLNLNLKPEDYLMSGQDVQDTINQAGRGVQTARQSQMEDTYRRALASGNVDPMALAALGRESQGRANEEAANAQTDAGLQARGQQRGLAMNYAQANLGAGQARAGMQVGAQENLLGQQLGSQNAYEAMRMGLTADQLAAVQAQTGAQMGAGQYLGSTGLGMEQGIGNQAANTQQYVTGLGTQIAGNVNQLNTNFANQQYQNRLQNAMYQQQNTYSQNTGVQDRQAAAYQAAAQARIGGQNKFLDWSTGQTGQAVGQGQTAAQQRIGAFGSASGAANQATGQSGQYDIAKSAQPNWFDKLTGAAAGFAGGYFGAKGG